jgi:hypothetical protein
VFPEDEFANVGTGIPPPEESPDPELVPIIPSNCEIKESTDPESELVGEGGGGEFELKEGSFNRELTWLKRSELSCRKRFCPESPKFPLEDDVLFPNPKSSIEEELLKTGAC